MKKGIVVLILLTGFGIVSCGPSEKQQRLKELHDALDRETRLLRNEQDHYNDPGGSEINEYVSKFVGVPVTEKQLRKGAIENHQYAIEDIKNEIERVRDE